MHRDRQRTLGRFLHLPAFKAQGATVLTIEGLADAWCAHGKVTMDEAAASASGEEADPEFEHLHPLQQAFVAHGATQCGFCTPGIIMQTRPLIEQNPAASEEEIKHCLKDTVCRCTGHACGMVDPGCDVGS